MVSSETTIKYLEEDIAKLEDEIADLTPGRQNTQAQEPINMGKMKATVRRYLEHLDELLFTRRQ